MNPDIVKTISVIDQGTAASPRTIRLVALAFVALGFPYILLVLAAILVGGWALTTEVSSVVLRGMRQGDRAIVTWWGTRIECMSAIARYVREQRLSATEVATGRRRLASLAEEWTEIQPDEVLRTTAERVVGVHSLRAEDAFQLAAALVACDGSPAKLAFVCLDTRLRDAAVREGFHVIPDAPPRATAARERTLRRQKASSPRQSRA